MWSPASGLVGGLAAVSISIGFWCFMVFQMLYGPYPLKNTTEGICFFALINFLALILTGAGVWLAKNSFGDCWLRLTSKKLRKIITLSSVAHSTNTGNSVVYTGTSMIVIPAKYDYTTVTCEEFPDDKLLAVGNQPWKVGDTVAVTMWFRGEELVDYVF